MHKPKPIALSPASFWALAVIILLLAFGLRVRGLDSFNLSWDEGYSSYLARLPAERMIEMTARDVHPPLFYFLLSVTEKFTGRSEFALRYPSALMGVIGVALTYALARAAARRQQGATWMALGAALLLALARAHLSIAQDTRMHVMAFDFCTLALWALLKYWQDPPARGRYLALYALAALAGLYTYYLAATLLIVTNLTFLALWLWQKPRRGRDLAAWIGVHLLIAAAFVPWALYTYGLLLRGPSPSAGLSPLIYAQFYFITLTSGLSIYLPAYIPLYASVLAVMGGGLWLGRRTLPRTPLILMLCALLVPLAVVFAATLPFHSLARPVAARYFLSLSAAFYVLVALAVGMIVTWARRGPFARRLVALCALAITLGVPIYGLLEMPQLARRDMFHGITATLTAHRHDRDGLMMHTDRDWPNLAYQYLGYDLPERRHIPNAMTVTPENVDYLLADFWAANDGVWLVHTQDSLVNDPDQLVTGWLDARAVAQRTWQYNQHSLTLYARTAERARSLDDLAAGHVVDDARWLPDAPIAGVDAPLTRVSIDEAFSLAVYWRTPPTDAYSVTLTGAEVQRTVTVPAPSVANRGLTRQLLTIPLTIDLPTGPYRVIWEDTVLADLQAVRGGMPDLSAEPTEIPNPLNWTFGDGLITLLGYDLTPAAPAAGDEVTVTLYWRAERAIDRRYKVSIRAEGAFNPSAGNPLWGQVDTEPFNWQVPTTAWPAGMTLTDRYAFRLAADTPAGSLDLKLVLYGTDDGQRLPLTDANGAALGTEGTLIRLSLR